MTASPPEPAAADAVGRLPSSGSSDAAPGAHSTDVSPHGELLRGIAALPTLIDAYRSGDRVRLKAVRDKFQHDNGYILDSYFSQDIEACAILVQKPSPEEQSSSRDKSSLEEKLLRQHLFIWINHRDVEPVGECVDALWRTLWLSRQTEGAPHWRVPGMSRAVVANMIYTVGVFLLHSIDFVEHAGRKAMTDADRRQLLLAAARSANVELDKLEHFLDKEAIRVTVRYLPARPGSRRINSSRSDLDNLDRRWPQGRGSAVGIDTLGHGGGYRRHDECDGANHTGSKIVGRHRAGTRSDRGGRQLSPLSGGGLWGGILRAHRRRDHSDSGGTGKTPLLCWLGIPGWFQ
jgi:hypothetical protein